MNNIKTVEVIKALPGLEAGDTLTRKDGDSNFELNIETITEDYSAVRHISISQSLLNKEEFKAIDWFEKRTPNKEKIASLEKELYLTSKRLELIEKRIDSKINEFEKEFNRVENNFADGMYFGEAEQWADESMTVHYNMIDLLKKIKA
jgi:hypothetical protein